MTIDFRKEKYVVLKIGYNEFVLPMVAAQKFFETLASQDVYSLDSNYRDGGHVKYLRDTKDKEICLMHISPSELFAAAENEKMRQEEEARKEAAKAAGS